MQRHRRSQSSARHDHPLIKHKYYVIVTILWLCAACRVLAPRRQPRYHSRHARFSVSALAATEVEREAVPTNVLHDVIESTWNPPTEQPPPPPLSGSNLASAAVLSHQELDYYVNNMPEFGACFESSSVLSGVANSLCLETTCIVPSSQQAAVALIGAYPFFTAAGQNKDCAPAQGGQVASPSTPAVSLVLVVDADPKSKSTAAQALYELFKTAREVPSAEFIVVGDDLATLSALQHVAHSLGHQFGVKVYQINVNSGTSHLDRLAAGVGNASAPLVATINSDVLVVRGWLAVMFQSTQSGRHPAVVYPTFVGQNTVVQQAGGIVWANGTCTNYGRGMSARGWLPDHVAFARPVDFGSTACMLVGRDTFERVYADLTSSRDVTTQNLDVEFAFAARAAGATVLFQPLAVVHRTMESTACSDMNKASDKSFTQSLCPPRSSLLAASRRLLGPSIFMVDMGLPQPDKDSGSVRAVNLVRILLDQGYAVTYQVIHGNADTTMHNTLRSMGVRVPPAGALASEWPLLSSDGQCMHAAFVVARRDVALTSLLWLKATCPRAPIIYDTVDVHFLREARLAATDTAGAEQGRSTRTLWNFNATSIDSVLLWLQAGNDTVRQRIQNSMHAELDLMHMTEATWVVSPNELDMLRAHVDPTKLSLVSNIHDVPPLASDGGCTQRRGVLFVGNFLHEPNQQAIVTLLFDVLPGILKALPPPMGDDFVVHIVGANKLPPDLEARIRALQKASPHVVFHGHLSDADLGNLYRRVRVVVAPLLTGAGVKGKVNEAMKMGTPVVATPIAVEGMHVRDGVEGMVATSVDDFVDKTVLLYTQCLSLWPRIVRDAHKSMQQHFGMEFAQKQVGLTFDRLGLARLKEASSGLCN